MKATEQITYRTVEYRRICENPTNGKELMPFVSYGIDVYRGDEVIAMAKDLSPDRDTVTSLTESFNLNLLDPIHFEQAVEDFLTDFQLPK